MKKIQTTSFDFFIFFSPLLLLKLQGTNRYFQRIAAEVGLDVSLADCTKPEKLKSALKPNTKVSQARLSKNWHLPIDLAVSSLRLLLAQPEQRGGRVKRGQMVVATGLRNEGSRQTVADVCSFFRSE